MRALLILLVAELVTISVGFSQPDPHLVWERSFGGPYEEMASSVRQTPDGGYVIAGTTALFGNQTPNIYLVRVNSQGDTLWTRQYGADWSDEVARSLEVTDDGGFVLAGYTNALGGDWDDMYLIRTDSAGVTLWTGTYGGARNDEAYAAKQTTDGGYILVGWTGSYGPAHRNVYLVKTDAGGDTLWTRVYGTDGVEEAWSVQQTLDGGFVVAGYADGHGEDTDMYLLRTDSQGDTLWTRKYGGSSNEGAYTVLQTADSAFALAGLSWSFGPPAMYLVKTDAMGNAQWSRAYARGSDTATDMQQTTDGGYVLAGYSVYWNDEVLQYDAQLVRTDSNGDTLWTTVYGDSGAQMANSVRITGDGGYILAGSTDSGPGGVDFYVVKTGNEAMYAPPLTSRPSPTAFTLTASPNPFNATTTIRYDVKSTGLVTLRVFDLLGRDVATLIHETTPAGSYSVAWNAGDLPSGIYFCRMEAGEFTATRKMLLLK
jgi:hypothetical protein